MSYPSTLSLVLYVDGKRSRVRQRVKVLDGLKLWLKVGRVTDALKATGDRDAWKVMIVCAKEHGT